MIGIIKPISFRPRNCVMTGFANTMISPRPNSFWRVPIDATWQLYNTVFESKLIGALFIPIIITL